MKPRYLSAAIMLALSVPLLTSCAMDSHQALGHSDETPAPVQTIASLRASDGAAQNTGETSAASTTATMTTTATTTTTAATEVSGNSQQLATNGLSASRRLAVQQYDALVATEHAESVRPEAMRRLADLKLEADERNVAASIALYRERLQRYPDLAGNDRVLYQLSRALDQAGNTDEALATLQRLIRDFPHSPYLAEAWFRLGEASFIRGDYSAAHADYQTVLDNYSTSPFYDRALYKHGWSLFKLAEYARALPSFTQLLDRQLGNRSLQQAELSRSERELLEDTLRVITLTFSNLDGSRSLSRFFSEHGNKAYEGDIYQRLAQHYLTQERFQDAAETYNAFLQQHPNDADAPQMATLLIDSYKRGRFPSLLIQAKREYVERFAADSDYWQHHDRAANAGVTRTVQQHLIDLAKQHHASMQQAKGKAEKQAAMQLAVQDYRRYLHLYPDSEQALSINFLLAELLMEQAQYAQAAAEYERSAYGYPTNAAREQRDEAGYRALLAYEALLKPAKGAAAEAADPAPEKMAQAALASALRFIATFPAHPQQPAVLGRSAERLFQQRQYAQALPLTQQLLDRQPTAPSALRLTALTIQAHIQFERQAYAEAEQGYRQALLEPALKGKAQQPQRQALTTRLAASVYKQGEQARDRGELREAVGHFRRIAELTPAEAIRQTADYDLAAALLALEDWPAAITALRQYQDRYLSNPHTTPERAHEIERRLAVAYENNHQYGEAAQAYTQVAANSHEADIQRRIHWQIAELFAKAGDVEAENRAWKAYIAQHPQPFEALVEAQQRLADHYARRKDEQRRRYWLKRLIASVDKAGQEQTDRTLRLAAKAALEQAQPLLVAFTRQALKAPLKQNLRKKKALMQTAIKAYEKVSGYAIADTTTEATYRIADIYRGFARALIESERPKGLSAEELEEYGILLEDQAYPFEQKAIAIHEINARRIAQGINDDWSWQSLQALGQLFPLRYAKQERGDDYVEHIE